VRILVTRPNGFVVEVVTRDDRIRARVPFEPMGFDQAVRRALTG
jgi:hypothetical protein